MQRTLMAVAGMAVLLCAAAAQTPKPNPKLDSAYARLTAKLASPKDDHRPQDLASLAELDYAFGDQSFHAGQPEVMMNHLNQAAAHAGEANALLAQEAAAGRKDGMKHVEQSLQRITFNLRSLALSGPLAQRPALHQLAEHFADLRAQVLQWMFASKKQ